MQTHVLSVLSVAVIILVYLVQRAQLYYLPTTSFPEQKLDVSNGVSSACQSFFASTDDQRTSGPSWRQFLRVKREAKAVVVNGAEGITYNLEISAGL